MSSKETDPHAVFATNANSDFTPFSLTLSNGGTLTGIAHIPTSGLFYTSPFKPLLIGIHGASCSAYNYDVNPRYTASVYSSLTRIPFVAFHRPNFLGTSGWLRQTDQFKEPDEGVSYFEEEARWYDEYIFPALWETFGKPNGCKAIVTTSHSMAVPVTVISAGYYSQNPKKRAYPWAGMVGFGVGEEPLQTQLRAGERMSTIRWDPAELPLGHDDNIHIGPFLKEDKISLMLGPPGCCEDELRELCWKQNTPFLLAELLCLNGVWREKEDRFKAAVKIPVLYGIGTMEWLWKYEQRHLELFTKPFVNAPRVEGAVIPGAPHAIEWSRMAGGWWLRVFGWAVEVTTSKEMQTWNLQQYK